MSQYSRNKIQDFLARSDTAPNADKKGEIFEDLVIYIFTKCKGIRFKDRDILDSTGAREFDVALGNNRVISAFDFLDPIIICECKNEATPLGANVIRDFHQKLRTSGANNGIIISSNGISGQTRRNNLNALSAITDAMVMDKIKILVLTRAEILTLQTTEDLGNLISEKFDKLTLRRIAI